MRAAVNKRPHPQTVASISPTVTALSQQSGGSLCVCAGCVSWHLTAHLISQRSGDRRANRRKASHRLVQMISSEGKAFNISLRPMLSVRGRVIAYSRFRRWRLHQVSIKTARWGGGSHASGRMCPVSLYYAEWRLCYFRWRIFQGECCNAAVRCFWSINNWEKPWSLKNSWNGGRAMFV